MSFSSRRDASATARQDGVRQGSPGEEAQVKLERKNRQPGAGQQSGTHSGTAGVLCARLRHPMPACRLPWYRKRPLQCAAAAAERIGPAMAEAACAVARRLASRRAQPIRVARARGRKDAPSGNGSPMGRELESRAFVELWKRIAQPPGANHAGYAGAIAQRGGPGCACLPAPSGLDNFQPFSPKYSSASSGLISIALAQHCRASSARPVPSST